MYFEFLTSVFLKIQFSPLNWSQNGYINVYFYFFFWGLLLYCSAQLFSLLRFFESSSRNSYLYPTGFNQFLKISMILICCNMFIISSKKVRVLISYSGLHCDCASSAHMLWYVVILNSQCKEAEMKLNTCICTFYFGSTWNWTTNI